MLTFAYIVGWRIPSEVQKLERKNVNFEEQTVSLFESKTDEPYRVFPFSTFPELRDLLLLQEERTKAVELKTGQPCKYLFHRNGNRIKDFGFQWDKITKEREVDLVPHDFRRSAVRNLVRAGVPEKVAMQMTGHKTRAVFERYNVSAEDDLEWAAGKLQKKLGTILGTIVLYRKNGKR